MKNKINFLVSIFLFTNLFSQTETISLRNKLTEGNKRFVFSKMIHPNTTDERRIEVARGQNPFAVIVTCSDSRVPPEIIFDQGLGDLFVIRTAGNVVDDVAIASIEYAVEHLGVKLIVVMGHQKCGAISAAVQGGELHGHLNFLVDAIAPAVEAAKKKAGNLLDNTIQKNVELVVDQLKNSKPILHEFYTESNLNIIGAVYNLETGKVDFLMQE